MINIKTIVNIGKLFFIIFNENNRAKLSSLLSAFIKDVNNKSASKSVEKNTYSDYLHESVKDKKFLLVIHEFSRTGAPYAVLYLARAIQKIYGECPVVVSPIDGPIRDDFENEGFLTYVDPYLFVYNESSYEACKFIKSFEYVVVTSMCSFGFIRFFRGVAKNIFWWLHEVGENMDLLSKREDFLLLTFSCKQIWFGSPLCDSPAFSNSIKKNIHTLFYGCPDVAVKRKLSISNRIVFTVFGTIDYRKGQDVFVEAVSNLSYELKEKAIFRVIGSPATNQGSEFYERIKAKAEEYPGFEFYENMPMTELLKYYEESDIFVSTSRADPMPIVITQGLMYSRVCLCSSVVGQARLIDHGVNGLVFLNESVEDLVEKITWALANKEQLGSIGVGGRKIYEKYFSEGKFINRLEELLND